jgi:hypothetical protein
MTLDPSELPEDQRNEILAQEVVVSMAWGFLESFYEGDFASAWEKANPVFRLCLAQWWAHGNKDKLQASGYDFVTTAEGLALRAPGEHPLWDQFAGVVLRDFRKAYPLDVAAAAIGSAPRPIAIDTELLYVHPEMPEGGLWQADERREVYSLLMKFETSKWTVLNWASERIPTPGYPPSL